MTRFGLALVALLASSPALAGDPVSVSEKITFLNAVAGNAAAGSLTFTVPLANSTAPITDARQIAVLYFNANYTTTMSAVTLTCSASDDSGASLFVLQDCSVSSGACTSSDVSWTKAITADKKWVWRVDFTSMIYGSCVVVITGGAADESITVTGYLTTK